MPTLTITTCDVGAYLELDHAVRDLAYFVMEWTRNKMPDHSSDVISVPIEAVLISRVVKARLRTFEAREEAAKEQAAKAERKAAREAKRAMKGGDA
jgi:hypothetical protein